MSKKKSNVTLSINKKGQTVRTTLQRYKNRGRTGVRQTIEVLKIEGDTVTLKDQNNQPVNVVRQFKRVADKRTITHAVTM